MSEPLDMDAIYRQERKRWYREEAPRRSFQDIVADSVPYWIIIVALVLFGLSAPHTASIFDMLTPGWGFIAPIGVEFGLLYAAFRRRLARSDKQLLPWTLWAMEILLFITAILVNGAGSFVSVVETTEMDTLSFTAILDGFSGLPATNQAALVMAGLSAFIIPIGTLVAGDGLADLALEHRGHDDFREERWREVEFTVVYRAVFVQYLQQGLTDKEARKRASSEVKGYLGQGHSSSVRLLSAPVGQNGHADTSGQTGQHKQYMNEQQGSVRQRVMAYLNEHPELAQYSVNQVLAQVQGDGVKAGRTTVAEVLKEWKSRLYLADEQA